MTVTIKEVAEMLNKTIKVVNEYVNQEKKKDIKYSTCGYWTLNESQMYCPSCHRILMKADKECFFKVARSEDVRTGNGYLAFVNKIKETCFGSGFKMVLILCGFPHKDSLI